MNDKQLALAVRLASLIGLAGCRARAEREPLPEPPVAPSAASDPSGKPAARRVEAPPEPAPVVRSTYKFQPKLALAPASPGDPGRSPEECFSTRQANGQPVLFRTASGDFSPPGGHWMELGPPDEAASGIKLCYPRGSAGCLDAADPRLPLCISCGCCAVLGIKSPAEGPTVEQIAVPGVCQGVQVCCYEGAIHSASGPGRRLLFAGMMRAAALRSDQSWA